MKKRDTTEDIQRRRKQKLAGLVRERNAKLGRGGQAALANDLGIAPSYLSQLLSTEGGKKSRPVKEETAREFELKLGLRQGWFDTDELPGPEPQPPGIPDYRFLPIVSSIRAGTWGDVVDPYEPGDAHEFAAVIGKFSDSAFVLIVEGDSMTSNQGLSIPEGSHVIVEPEQEAKNRDIVVAKLDYEAKAMIKRLVFDPPKAYLFSLNDKYKPTEINSDCRIVGVVKRFFMDIR